MINGVGPFSVVCIIPEGLIWDRRFEYQGEFDQQWGDQCSWSAATTCSSSSQNGRFGEQRKHSHQRGTSVSRHRSCDLGRCRSPCRGNWDLERGVAR